ncbi:MAG: amino acid adenylation domain-containing protein [Micrococcales bacterium]|nr:amino acid adenylation domain-containing protein [Micrococcales bacterium]
MSVVSTYPARFFQRNLYLRSQAFPDDPSADLAFAFRITGDADWERLLLCARTAVAASPGLRTRFEVRGGRLVAVVADEVPSSATVEVTDDDPVRVAVGALSRALDAGPVDPDGPSLFEVSLFVGTSQVVGTSQRVPTACLTLRAAHLVGDAISFASVLGCVSDLYAAPEADWPSIVAPLAEHPGSTPAVPVLRRGRDAYQTMLGAPDSLSHPALSRPGSHRIDGAHHELLVEGPRAQRLRGSEVAQTFGAPTAFFTAYAATLQRLAGTREVTLGVPVANRSRPAVRAVGCYVNTLLLPLTLDRSDTWLTVAGRVQAGTRLLMANQGLDLLGDDADIVGRRVERIDNAVTFYDQGLGLSLAGLTVEAVPVPRTCVQYPLVVTVEDRGPAGFRVGTAAASYLAAADPAAIFDEALESLVAQPSGGVVGPSVFVSAWERPEGRAGSAPDATAVLSAAVVDASVSPPASGPTYRDVIERIWSVAARQPDTQALVSTSPVGSEPSVDVDTDSSAGPVPAVAPGPATAPSELTYGEMVRQAEAVARGLDAAEATRAVVMAVPKSIDAVVTVLGVLASGRAYVPVDPAGPPERLRSVLTQVAEAFGGPPTIVTADGAPLAGSVSRSVTELAEQAPADAVAQPRPYDPHDLAYIIFTSGSTGAPKGVMIERHNIVDLLDGADVHLQLDRGPAEVWCLFHSLAFDFSVWEMFGALAHGHTLVVPSPDDIANPEAFVALLTEQQVTVLNQTPSAFRRLRTALVRTGGSLPQVRWAIFGGEALYPADVAAWLDAGLGEPAFVNMYGITETTVHTTVHRVTPADLERPQTSVIGRALPGWGTVVVDETGRRCPPGIPGELLVTGNGLARGYLGRPDLTGDRFRWLAGDGFDGDRLGGGTGPVRAYRSGDRVCQVGDELVYHGRIDNQVQLRGFRIEMGDVAAGLESTSGVHAAVVRPVRTDGREPFLAAWVVPTTAETTVEEIRTAAAQVLPDYMLPSRIVFVDHIPTTQNGKPDMDALTLPPLADVTAPSSSTAVQIAAIWEQVIGAGPVGVDDRFMDVGGTSMHVMEIHDLLSDRFEVEWLTLVDLFTHPTPQQLAARIEQGQPAIPTTALAREEAAL